MTRVRDLLARDLSQRIEEIIQLDQTDEASVYAEITEYVVTERICNQYRQVLREIAEAPRNPHAGVGVWISGFFGSGKSAFAKNLGYVLANPMVLGEPAGRLFASRVADRSLVDLIQYINSALPTTVIMFDIQKDQVVRDASKQKIAEVMYTVFLRELGYAEDYDIAELEIELEGEGKLEEFVERCQAIYGQPWTLVRKGAQKISRASAILHKMDPVTYPDAATWATSLSSKNTDITITRFVDRAFDLMARRRPGQGLVFIIDEVGQYVGRSSDKIEDLRAVVEAFGREGKNRVSRRQAVAPVWIVVTSQEKLEEVVSSLDSRRVELARLQDRFRQRIDLAPADIREVASRRVLAKRAEAVPILRELFSRHQGQLNTACRLERSSLRTDISAEEFVQFYPYLPHFIDLSIQIMAGIRLQPGAPRHYGGSNRTIIKQAYEVLVSERTRLAERPVGTLVTLDRLYELVEGNLSSERQKDIADIARYFADDSEDQGWALRVAKALALLEHVRDLPRTDVNIAAVLVDEVGRAAPRAEVSRALRRLEQAQFIRQTEHGWKLQTVQEKTWESERRAFLAPKPSERHQIKREVLKAILVDDARVRSFRFRDLATFSISVSVDGVRLGDGGRIPVEVIVAEDPEELASKADEALVQSRDVDNRETIYWVFSLTGEIDTLVAELHASRQMIRKYDQLRAQQRITPPEDSSLASERERASRLKSHLEEKMSDAFCQGRGFFQGVSRDGSELGSTVAEVLHAFLALAIPKLYPRLEMGSRPLKGTEAEEILKAANLNGLSRIFYDTNDGLGLVVKEGNLFVIDKTAPVAKEILDYLQSQHEYGNKVTGKSLEERFQSPPYGWGIDLLRVVLATLFRAGAIEVTHGGRPLRDYQDPHARAPFARPAAFRSASFAPREAIDLKTLTTAAEHYEALVGREVDVEPNAIAGQLKELARDELRKLLPVLAEVQAHHLPVLEELDAYRESLEAIEASDADGCVRILAGEGRTLREQRKRIQGVHKALSEGGLDRIRSARRVCDHMVPTLIARGHNGELEAKVKALTTLLASPSLMDQLDEVGELSTHLEQPYRVLYTDLHEQRARRVNELLEELKGRPEWVRLSEEMRESVAGPLVTRGCGALELEAGALTCTRCKATVKEMESDLAALEGLYARILLKLEELITPERPVERVRVARFFSSGLDSEEAVDEGIQRLREYLYKRLAEGVKIVLE